jgi:hypothetical protein
VVQATPSGAQAHTSLQVGATCDTQIGSQVLSQQKGSILQMAAMQGSHVGESLAPVVHSWWEQGLVGPQAPPLHWLLQHWPGTAHGEPSGWQELGPQRPVAPHPLQHGSTLLHLTPSGRQIAGTHRLLLQMPLQQGG